MPAALGVTGGGLGLLALFVVLFLRREADRAGRGEPTRAQQAAAHTSNPYDDKAADVGAMVLAKLDGKVDALSARIGEVAAKIKPGN